ncbi:urease accessory protein UreD [Phormidesmis sp. 146-35]
MNQPHPVSTDVPTDWHGRLCLEFVNRQGTTQLIRNLGQAPFKVQRPFYPEGDEVCHSVILHTAGGLVGGDRLSCDLRLHPTSRALITTAAAAKIYRTTGKPAQQSTHLRLDADACLEWLPQETIVFNQSIYRQHLRVDLAPGACWLGWDLTRFGRSARGEKFVEGEWRSHTEVWQEDRPLWIDRQRLVGSEESFTSPHGLNNCPVIGSLALVGQSVEPEFIEKARSLWTGNPEFAGVTRLISGLLCRYRGHSTMEARQWFVEVWRSLRGLYCDRPVCIPRVWQL